MVLSEEDMVLEIDKNLDSRSESLSSRTNRLREAITGQIHVPSHLGHFLTLDEIRPTLRIPDHSADPMEQAVQLTEGRIWQARYDAEYFDLDNPVLDPQKRLDSGKIAFLVHTRDDFDITRQFPALDTRDLGTEPVHELFRLIPPFRASTITSKKGGQEIHEGIVVISTIHPEQFMDRKQLPWMRENILKTARLAWYLGADVLGTGAMTAMLTHYGRDIEEHLPLKVTTGHSYTSKLIEETLLDAAKKTDQNLRESVVAIVGGAGSIGSTAAHLIAPHVGRLILIDRERQQGKLNELAAFERTLNPDTQIECHTVLSTNDENYNVLRQANFVITATTQPAPFIKPDWLKPGVVFIDDSAPFNIAPYIAESVGGVTLHVVSNTPNELNWNFPFGLAEGSSFGCGAEVSALARMNAIDQGITGEISNGTVGRIAKIARDAGFGLGPSQSFGELKTEVDFDRVARIAKLNK